MSTFRALKIRRVVPGLAVVVSLAVVAQLALLPSAAYAAGTTYNVTTTADIAAIAGAAATPRPRARPAAESARGDVSRDQLRSHVRHHQHPGGDVQPASGELAPGSRPEATFQPGGRRVGEHRS